MDSNNGLGKLLKAVRKKKSFSQAEIAGHLGLKSGQSISDWERGYGSPIPIKALKKLIHIYELKVEEVLELYLQREKEKLAVKLSKEFFSS